MGPKGPIFFCAKKIGQVLNSEGLVILGLLRGPEWVLCFALRFA
jgi:hypothetical protein